MSRGVRQGCPASDFLFAMAFDPIFRWLQESIIPRNLGNLEYLQLVQCAFANDLAIASSSSRELMVALAPAVCSIDCIGGLTLSFRKRCWFQYGNDDLASLRTWISENCEEFREMQSVEHAKHVGTMIGPDGHVHRWTAAQKKSFKATLKAENHASSVQLQYHTTLYLSNLQGVGSVFGLGPDIVGMHSIRLAARNRTAARSTTL